MKNSGWDGNERKTENRTNNFKYKVIKDQTITKEYRDMNI